MTRFSKSCCRWEIFQIFLQPFLMTVLQFVTPTSASNLLLSHTNYPDRLQQPFLCPHIWVQRKLPCRLCINDCLTVPSLSVLSSWFSLSFATLNHWSVISIKKTRTAGRKKLKRITTKGQLVSSYTLLSLLLLLWVTSSVLHRPLLSLYPCLLRSSLLTLKQTWKDKPKSEKIFFMPSSLHKAIVVQLMSLSMSLFCAAGNYIILTVSHRHAV